MIYSPLNNVSGIIYMLYVVFSFLIAPFACRDYYGVLVVVSLHYYRACYCEIAEDRLDTLLVSD